MKHKKPKRPAPITWDDQPGQGSAQVLRGEADEHLGFRIDRPPIPAREFEAEVAWAEKRHGALCLLFGKTAASDRSRIAFLTEIRISYEAFESFWGSVATGFRTRLQDWAVGSADYFDSEARPSLPPADALLSYAWFRATVLLASHAGSEGEMAFYAIPVSSIARAIGGDSAGRVPLVPLIRVTMTGHQLAALLDECERIHAEVAPLVARGARLRSVKEG